MLLLFFSNLISTLLTLFSKLLEYINPLNTLSTTQQSCVLGWDFTENILQEYLKYAKSQLGVLWEQKKKEAKIKGKFHACAENQHPKGILFIGIHLKKERKMPVDSAPALLKRTHTALTTVPLPQNISAVHWSVHELPIFFHETQLPSLCY